MQSLLDPEVTARVLERLRDGPEEDERLARLTEQERRILDLIAEGLTNRQIAERMFLAEKTVKNYVSNLLAKLGMERRTEAAVLRGATARPPPVVSGRHVRQSRQAVAGDTMPQIITTKPITR